MTLMTLFNLFVFCLITISFATTNIVGQEAGEVQATLKQWVETKQLISRERAAWAVEKETLSDLNEIRKREIGQLDEFTKAAATRITEIDEKRKKITEEELGLEKWRKDLGAAVNSLEDQLRPLIILFPIPLRSKVEEAILRIETPDPKRPLQHRSRDLLLVMQAYLNFRNSVTLDKDIRHIDGEEREVDVLYLGMTQAWYVDQTGSYSGYGVPSSKGWVWTEEPILAASVAEAIAIQTRRATPAFVRLPILNAEPPTK